MISPEWRCLVIECITVPLIGLLIALFGVFFDAKSRPRSAGTITLVALLIITAFYTGWSTWDNNRKLEQDKQQAIEDKNVLRDTLNQIATNLSNVGNGINSIAEYFGIKESNRTASVFAKSMQADEALARLSTPETNRINKKITVQYFPKDIDRDLVQSALVAALSKAGFSITSGIGNPTLTATPTNCIWYGSNVTDESIRTVALALTRAGVQIRGIKPYSDPNKPSRINLIQIGSWIEVQNKAPYSVEQISSMQFER